MKLQNAVATVTAVNPRKERHGENLVLTMDVNLKVSCEASVLDQLDPALKAHVFGEHGPLFPEIKGYSWGREFENCELTIDGEKYRGVTARKIGFTPGAGGSVSLDYQATFYPEVEQVGVLSDLLQEQVVISLEVLQPDLVDQQKQAA